MKTKLNKTLDLFNKRKYRRRVTVANDRLQVLIDDCAAQIRDTETALAKLKARRANLIELARRGDALTSTAKPKDKYAGMKPIKAILDAVESLWKTGHCNKRGARPYQVKNYLLENGFVPEARQFEIAINVTLRRLAESGRIRCEQLGPDKFYRPME